MGYKKSRSTQLRMKFFLLINVLKNGNNCIYEQKKVFYAYLSLEKAEFFIFLNLWAFKISCSAMLSTLGPDFSVSIHFLY